VTCPSGYAAVQVRLASYRSLAYLRCASSNSVVKLQRLHGISTSHAFDSCSNCSCQRPGDWRMTSPSGYAAVQLRLASYRSLAYLRCASSNSVVKLQRLHGISHWRTNSISVNSYIELHFSPTNLLLTASAHKSRASRLKFTGTLAACE
jgi:predicted nucleic acid-binding Zn ribbon protein